jgi:hypothetical protein
VLDVVGAFAEDHAFEIALRGKLAGHEYCAPISYRSPSLTPGEHPRGVQDHCEEIANAETLDAFAFEGHFID